MKLIPMLMVAGALLATAMPANAQNRRANNDRVADQLNAQVLEVLRAGQVPVAPVASVAPTVVTAPAVSPLAGVYVGGFAGSNFRDATDYQVGGVLGYQINRNWGAEVTYDYNQLNNRTDGQMVMANVVYGRQVGQTAITPYVLAGTGMGWNALGVSNTGSNLALYNVGGGVRLNLVQNVDLDARYRYVGAFNDTLGANYNVVTGGINVRF